MTTIEATGNGVFTEGQLVAWCKAEGRKVSKALIHADKQLPKLTRDELKRLYERLTFDLLAEPDLEPELRREVPEPHGCLSVLPALAGA